MVVVVVVVVVLLLAGVIPGLKSSPASEPATTYDVTFTESGLPSATTWSVTLDGARLASTTASIVFSEPNGSYPYAVGTVANYSSAPTSGTVQVSGAPAMSRVSFTPTGPPIGSALAVGNPVGGDSLGTSSAASACPANGFPATTTASSIKAGDFTYTLTIEASTVTMTDVLFEVKTATDATYTATGGAGFYIQNIAGNVVACSSVGAGGALAMISPFSSFTAATGACGGATCGTSTPLTTIYSIVIDVGTINPAGTGLTFVVAGTNGYTGTTSPLGLP